ncbi:MAG: hypothetical protein HUU46_16050 [Candidatus Hydrogenedentes bacterium]|nr:hypothetical protein [Candidatus Hydrogenedentota bacterium]
MNEKAKGAEFVMGRNARLRFLKPTDAYGTLALLGASWLPETKTWKGSATWDSAKFGAKCSGCHASGVDSTTKTFQMPSLDCHTCHGLAVPEHTEDGGLMLLSVQGSTRPEVEVSICGSCHLRGGKSKSTGLAYPNNFVPGDNLLKDFEVELSEARIAKEGLGDAHILQNVRDVAVLGKTDMMCTTCHDVHGETAAKHTMLQTRPSCFVCHIGEGPLKAVRPYERHSETCEY